MSRLLDSLVPLFGTIFMFCVGVTVLRRGMRDLLRASHVPHWPRLPARVRSAKLRRIPGRGRFETEISYAYLLGDTEYQGTARSSDGDGWNCFSEETARRYLDTYPVGAWLLVYANPTSPHETVVEPVAGRQALGTVCFAAVVCLFSIGLSFLGLSEIIAGRF